MRLIVKRFSWCTIIVFSVVLFGFSQSTKSEPQATFWYSTYLPIILQQKTEIELGYQVEGYLRGREKYLIEGATVLLQLHWVDVEKTQGVYDWPVEFDQDVQRVSGQRLIISVKGTPAWARDGGLECEAPKPAYYAAFGKFVRSAAERYQPFGIEIWNEPDAKHSDPKMARFYGCIGSGAIYTEMVKVAYEGLRGTGVQTIAGALLGSPKFWLEATRSGINGWSDAISFHAYPMWPEPDLYLAFRQAWWIRMYSPNLPIYLTETSIICDASCGSEFLTAQANYLRYLNAQARNHGIELVLWYSLANNGWRNSDLVWMDIRRPVWFAMEEMVK